MKIAVIGCGELGTTLAEKWAIKGHEIFLGIPDEENSVARKLSLLYKNQIRVCTQREAALKAEIILLAIPLSSLRESIAKLGALNEKLLIDATNPNNELDNYSNSSEAILAWTNSQHIIKAFNSCSIENIKDPYFENNNRADVFYCGGSLVDKELFEILVHDLNMEAFDFGKLDQALLLDKLAIIQQQLATSINKKQNVCLKLLRKN